MQIITRLEENFTMFQRVVAPICANPLLPPIGSKWGEFGEGAVALWLVRFCRWRNHKCSFLPCKKFSLAFHSSCPLRCAVVAIVSGIYVYITIGAVQIHWWLYPIFFLPMIITFSSGFSNLLQEAVSCSIFLSQFWGELPLYVPFPWGTFFLLSHCTSFWQLSCLESYRQI